MPEEPVGGSTARQTLERQEADVMDRESVERLRFDRRLLRRRDRVAEAEYASYVEGLPDVSDKLIRIGDEREDSVEGSTGDAAESAGGLRSPGLGSEVDSSGPGGRSTPA